MLQDYREQLMEISAKRETLAEEYQEYRKLYGETKAELDIIFAGRILALQQKKKNIGYDTGLLLMISEAHDPTERTMLETMYKDMIKYYNKYKALEPLDDTLKSREVDIRKIMDYNMEHDS